MNTPILQRFLREPLLHFIVIGSLFFLLYSVGNDTGENSTAVILITPERIGQMASEYKGVWNRMPTAEELDSLIEEEVRSEIYYRDALSLGLDKNDAIVRRRLRQKMEFLTDTGVYLKEPAAGELETYFAENEQVYRSRPRLAFEQIYLGEAPPAETVSKTLERLQSEPAMDPSALGQRSLLPAQLRLSQPAAIDSVFGEGFYQQVADFSPGDWAGPVSSQYGTHLVRTLDRLPVRLPPLAEIREVVVKDWKSAQAKEYREQDYVKRRSRYSVEIGRGNKGGR